MEHSPDSSKSTDSFGAYTIFLLVATLIYFVRMCMDVFIMTVSCRVWVEKKRLSPTDKILALQGTVRMCCGSMVTIWFFLMKFSPWMFQISYIFEVFMFTFSCITSWNVWLTAFLCSYYCVKIADFRHPFFIHLKLRLSSKVVSIWLLGSPILSFACSLPEALRDREIQGDGNFSNFLQNKTIPDRYIMMVSHLKQTFLVFRYSAPFSICAISAALLLFSLWRHRQRMLGTWDSHSSPQAHAHFRAVITIFSLLITHVFLFVFLCVEGSLSFHVGNGTVQLGLSVGIYLCGLFESLITILGNKKFKKELHRCLCFPTCRGHVS